MLKRVLGLVLVATVVALPAGAARADSPADAPIVITDTATYEVNAAVVAVGVNDQPGEPVVFSITGEFAGPATQSVRAAAVTSRVLGPATTDSRGPANLTFPAAGLSSTGGNTSTSIRIGAILILSGLGLALMAAQRQRARAGR